MMNPKVSIIVPIYNVERYLDRCIQSLVNQTLHDIEIILVDDESPDNCPVMCDVYQARDSRIKVVHKKNGGLGFARNSGLEVATGKYVTYCDSDDWVEPNTYEVVYAKCEEKQLDICWFHFCRVKLDGLKISMPPVMEEYFTEPEAICEFHKDVIGRNVEDSSSKSRNMSSCMALFRRDTLINSGVRYPSERVVASEDLVFLVNYLPHVNRVGVLPNVFYNYYINPSSISTSYSQAKHQRLIMMLQTIKSYCLEHFEWDEIKNHYYYQQLRIMKVILKFTSYSKMSFWEKIRLLEKETKNELLTEFYNSPVVSKYSLFDRLYIAMMKLHCGLFFYLIYKMKKWNNDQI